MGKNGRFVRVLIFQTPRLCQEKRPITLVDC